MKLFSSPFTIDGPALSKASLQYSSVSGIPRTINLVVANTATGATLTLPANTTLPKAVYTLSLTPASKDCCCRSTLVYSDGCGPSTSTSTGSTYTGSTATTTTPVPSCT